MEGTPRAAWWSGKRNGDADASQVAEPMHEQNVSVQTEAPAPRLVVGVVDAPGDALLISVESFDDDAHRGGLIRVSPAVAADLPAAIAYALQRHREASTRAA